MHSYPDSIAKEFRGVVAKLQVEMQVPRVVSPGVATLVETSVQCPDSFVQPTNWRGCERERLGTPVRAVR